MSDTYGKTAQLKYSLNELVEYYKATEQEDKIGKIKVSITPKVHGTNAGIKFDTDGTVSMLSRNSLLASVNKDGELKVNSDNAGFIDFVTTRIDAFRTIGKLFSADKEVIVYGEFAGKGIQKGVGVNNFQKFFMIFAVKIDGHHVQLNKYICNEEFRIFNVKKIQEIVTYIHLDAIDESVEMIQKFVDEVEGECPVTMHLKNSDSIEIVTTLGEGVVIVHFDENSNRHVWKLKGDKHHIASNKVKHVPTAAEIEQWNYSKQIAESIVTDYFLGNAFDTVFGMGNLVSMRNIGEFLKFVSMDAKEETINNLHWVKENIKELDKFDTKKINKEITNITKDYFKRRVL